MGDDSKEVICLLHTEDAEECGWYYSMNRRCGLDITKKFVNISCPHRLVVQRLAAPVQIESPITSANTASAPCNHHFMSMTCHNDTVVACGHCGSLK